MFCIHVKIIAIVIVIFKCVSWNTCIFIDLDLIVQTSIYINSLRANFLEGRQHIFTFYIITPHCYDTGT